MDDLRDACPGPDCPMCSGEHCNKCDIGWYGQSEAAAGNRCECDVMDRHEGMQPGTPAAWRWVP